MENITGLIRNATDCYNMINENDKIAVGVSGGKDSISLLYNLNELSKYYPKKFKVIGITLDVGFDNMDFSPIKTLCEKENIEYHIIKTDIKEVVFDIRKEKNPCSLCAKMRRGCLNEKAKSLGCSKVALGHTKDDVIETFFLCLLYEGRNHTFSPVTYLSRTDITVIRPLIFSREEQIIKSNNYLNLPVIKSTCPVNFESKRSEIKKLIDNLDQENPGTRERIFNAVKNSKISGWYKEQP